MSAMIDPVPGRESVQIGDLRFRPMIGARELREGIGRVASRIAQRYVDKSPLLVCVLNGGAMFHADLVRMLSLPARLDYVRVASYHGGTSSSGRITFTAEPSTLIEGENVIIVEDIVDTGLTVDMLRRYFRERGAISVEVATLLYKPGSDRFGQVPEYVAFEIPDRFVVGFGLDYMGQGRNIPEIYVLDDGGDVVEESEPRSRQYPR